MNTARRALHHPRLLVVIGIAFLLLVCIAGYSMLPKDETPPPLTQADIDGAVSRITTQRLESLEATLAQTTTNLAQLHTRTNDQQTALSALQAEIAKLLEQLSNLRAKDDWQRALEQTQQHWQSAQAALKRHVQRLETQIAHARESESASKSAAAPSLPETPSFQVSAVEYWGDIPYVTVTSNTGEDKSLRQGQTHAGWRLAGVTSDHAVFVNGAHTHKLPIGR